MPSAGKFLRRRPARLCAAALLAAILLSSCESMGPHFEAERRDALRLAIAQQRFDQADALIARHGDIVSRGLALDYAIREGDVDGVRRYLDPPRVDQPLDADGATALMRAVSVAPDGRVMAIARLLLDAGADPGRTDRAGESARDRARARGHGALAALLGADADVRSAPPPRHVEWLPPVGRAVATAVVDPAGAAAKARPTGRGARPPAWPPLPADRSTADWLPGRLWRPVLDVASAGRRWHALRLHADGTGDLVTYEASARPPASVRDGHVAWEYYRGRLYLFVLSPEFGAYCESTVIAGDRIAVRCDDYEIAGDRWRPAPDGLLSPMAARALLHNGRDRDALRRSGVTESVLEDDAGRSCRPQPARRHPGVRPATRAAGSWGVFELSGFRMHHDASIAACSQQRARSAAWRSCREGARGARCVDAGGCPAGQATALAGAIGHDKAWLACAPTREAAARKALADCRASAGCDCSLLMRADPIASGTRPAACAPPRPARRVGATPG